MNDYRKRIYENYATNFQGRNAVFNEQESRRWRKGYKWWFKSWLPENKDAKILDVGCGSGMLLHYFKELGFKNLYGIDLSPEQVNISKQIIENIVLGNALDYLKIHPEEYDLIVGLDIIEHLYKDEILIFLESAFAALKKGGKLILQAPNPESPWGMSILCGDLTHEIGLTPKCLEKTLKMIGFKDIQGKECGPVPIGLIGCARFFMWKIIWAGLIFYNFIEFGNSGSEIYTRVFLITCRKR